MKSSIVLNNSYNKTFKRKIEKFHTNINESIILIDELDEVLVNGKLHGKFKRIIVSNIVDLGSSIYCSKEIHVSSLHIKNHA